MPASYSPSRKRGGKNGRKRKKKKKRKTRYVSLLSATHYSPASRQKKEREKILGGEERGKGEESPRREQNFGSIFTSFSYSVMQLGGEERVGKKKRGKKCP